MANSRLSAAFVRTAKPGRYCDGDGLYLLIKKSGGRFWVFRYKVNGGKLREAGLGRAGEERNCVRLSVARDKASILFRQIRNGIDPLAARDAATAAAEAAAQDATAKCVTFREAAQRFIDGHSATWRNPKHAAQWVSTIDAYANPVFGDVPVSNVEVAHVLMALEAIWLTKPETANRLRGRIEKVLDFAKAHGWRSGENPAAWKGNLALTLPARSKVRKVEHHAALPWREIGDFMLTLKDQAGTGARVPAERMKGGREHRVPLSEAALDVLNEMAQARVSNDVGALVFPGRDAGRPLSDMSLTAVLRRMNRGDLTAHGFRSSFRDWSAETTAYSAELVEMALAHTVGNKVEAAYRRGDLFEKRRRLMQDWADYCSMPRPGASANVLSLRRTAPLAGM
jgi:integrase